jgi:SOS-response transcriptional repressor LexA
MGIHSEFLPARTSRKDQAYDFIKRYILREGRSPTMEDVGAALGVSDTRAKALVKKLSAEKMIVRPAGGQRAITIPGLLEQHLIEQLRAQGVIVDEDFLIDGVARAFPKGHLPLVAVIEHIPDAQ